jgi:hypothetical protein
MDVLRWILYRPESCSLRFEGLAISGAWPATGLTATNQSSVRDVHNRDHPGAVLAVRSTRELLLTQVSFARGRDAAS